MPGLGLSFNVRVSGIADVLKRIAGIKVVVQKAFRDPKLRDYLLRTVKDRFAPAGSNPRAQTSPDGVKWAAPSYYTVISRKRNRNRFNQALVDTGLLRRSIAIIETRLSDLAIATNRAGIRIGIPTSSPAYRYGILMNYGGVTANGRPIPARPFLGIGVTEQKFIDHIVQQFLNSNVR